MVLSPERRLILDIPKSSVGEQHLSAVCMQTCNVFSMYICICNVVFLLVGVLCVYIHLFAVYIPPKGRDTFTTAMRTCAGVQVPVRSMPKQHRAPT